MQNWRHKQKLRRVDNMEIGDLSGYQCRRLDSILHASCVTLLPNRAGYKRLPAC